MYDCMRSNLLRHGMSHWGGGNGRSGSNKSLIWAVFIVVVGSKEILCLFWWLVYIEILYCQWHWRSLIQAKWMDAIYLLYEKGGRMSKRHSNCSTIPCKGMGGWSGGLFKKMVGWCNEQVLTRKPEMRSLVTSLVSFCSTFSDTIARSDRCIEWKKCH